MFVSFWRVGDDRFSSWQADRGHRRIVPGTVWKEGVWGLPHDLAGLVVEAKLNLDGGFWSCIKDGATFKSLGRKRTGPGRDVIRQHRQQLDDAEAAVHAHVAAWAAGRPTPTAAALDHFRELWHSLPSGMRLTVEWPSLQTRVEPAPAPRKRYRQRTANA